MAKATNEYHLDDEGLTWACEICTYHYSNKDSFCCDMCGNPRTNSTKSKINKKKPKKTKKIKNTKHTKIPLKKPKTKKTEIVVSQRRRATSLSERIEGLECSSPKCIKTNLKLKQKNQKLKYHKTLYQCECTNDCEYNHLYMCGKCSIFYHDDDDFKLTNKYVKAYSIDSTSVANGMLQEYINEMKLDEIKKIIKKNKKKFAIQIVGTVSAVSAIDFGIGLGTNWIIAGSDVIPGLAGAVIALIGGGIFGVSWIQYKRGKINEEQFLDRISRAKSVAMSGTISAVSSTTGFAVGVAIGGGVGSTCAPLIGTIVGATIGLIIGCIYQYLKYRKKYKKEKSKESEYKNINKVMLEKALKLFNYKKIDIKNKDKFNLNEIKIRYHVMARIYHPDRIDGDVTKMQDLNLCYGVLLAVWEDEYNAKQNYIYKNIMDLQNKNKKYNKYLTDKVEIYDEYDKIKNKFKF